jgi:hypothetical protein
MIQGEWHVRKLDRLAVGKSTQSAEGIADPAWHVAELTFPDHAPRLS